MQSLPFEDRRLYQRIPLSMNAYFFYSRKNRWCQARVRDISAKGVGLAIQHEWPEELDSDTTLELWLPMPNRDEFFYTSGDVVWTQRTGPENSSLGVNLRKVDLPGISQVMRTAKRAQQPIAVSA